MTAGELEGERSFLRWGGLAGVVGGALFIGVFVLVGVAVGADPAGPAGPISRFPEIRALRTVENGVYLVVLMLWVIHFLALYRVLRASRPAAATFGGGLAIVGTVVMAVGALPHAATVAVSDLYHAPLTTPADQAIAIQTWHATQAIFNALLVTGLVIVPVGLMLLGSAMLGAPAFGRLHGWATIGLGLIGAGTALVLLADPPSFVAAVGVFALIGFHLLVGQRLVSLSRAPERALQVGGATSAA
jgi:hypothetical protein